MALLAEGWDILWIILYGVCAMGLAISILGCMGEVALVVSEGAKGFLSTTITASLASDNGEEAENPGGSAGTDQDNTDPCSAVGAGTAGAEGTTKGLASARARSGSGGGESSGSSSGKMGVSSGRPKVVGEDRANAAPAEAPAASMGSSGGLHTTVAQKKAVVSKLLGRFENLPSLLNEEKDGDSAGVNDSDSEERFLADTENIATEELWQLAAEVTRKRFEQFGREIQGSLTRLDQHLDGEGLGDGEGKRKMRVGRERGKAGGLCASGGGGGGTLTEEELEELEVNTQALRRLSCSLKDMLRRCGGPSSPMESGGNPSPSRQHSSSNSRSGDYAAAAAAVALALEDKCFSLPDRTNPVATAASTTDSAVGNMNTAASDGADGFPRGVRACGERKKARRRISSATPSAAAASTNQNAMVTITPSMVCCADGNDGDGDASRVLPAASISGTASGPFSAVFDTPPTGETRVISRRSPLNAETKPGHRGAGIVRGAVATDAAAAVGTSLLAGDPSALDGSSVSFSGTIERDDGFALPVSAPRSLDATSEFTNSIAAANVAAVAESKSSTSSYGGYPPYSSAYAGIRASVGPDLGSTSAGFGCFFPSPPPPPEARGDGSGDGNGYCDVTGGYGGGGGVVQEARACAPAQHLANLRALLDGDEEEQRAAVAGSESSDSEDDHETGGQGPRESGGGGKKGKGGAVAGKGCTRA